MATKSHTPPAQSAQERDREICRTRYRETFDRLREAQRELSEADLSDARREEIEQNLEALSVEPGRTLRILLSWGGPSDGFDLTLDADGREVTGGVYFYQDWFTHNEVALGADEAQLVSDLYLMGDPAAFFSRE
jgi:hypothetical protein